jgi:hypothetical protein
MATIANDLLEPVIALGLLTAVMWCWMYATRIPAIGKANMTLDPILPNGEQMSQLPASVRWKADNYNHLLQQPPLFYATSICLALLGDASETSLVLAWTYVGLRVVHSLHQSLWNKIELRFVIFSISSLVLFALVIRAALIVWGG